MMRLTTGMVLLGGLVVVLAQDASPSANQLNRRYTDGERFSYLMTGHNNDRPFAVRLDAVVKRGADGQFGEEYAWSDLAWGGTPQPLTAQSREFRQMVTLAGGPPFAFPDLSRVQPGLIGPITDLLTFYADLFLATKVAQLRQPGDRFYFPNPAASSWADGTFVLTGEDSIDFDITLTSIDRSRGVATLQVKHVPPKAPTVRFPAEWMRVPVADTPNNWVQVRRANGRYVAAVGKETFDVQLTIGLAAGQIVSATMDNIVEAVARECADVALTDCSESRPSPTVRRIEMSRM